MWRFRTDFWAYLSEIGHISNVNFLTHGSFLVAFLLFLAWKNTCFSKFSKLYHLCKWDYDFSPHQHQPCLFLPTDQDLRLVWLNLSIYSKLIYRSETGLNFSKQDNKNILDWIRRLPGNSREGLSLYFTSYAGKSATLKRPVITRAKRHFQA